MVKNIALVFIGLVVGAVATGIYTGQPARSDFSQSGPSGQPPDVESAPRLPAPEAQPESERLIQGERASTELRRDSLPTTSQSEPPASVVEIAPSLSSRQAADGRAPGERGSVAATDTTTRLPLLPEEYQRIVEPKSQRALRLDELVTRFAGESRDEAWAYTMELGIRQHVASSAVLNGATIDYVECRSTACVMAGWVQPGMADGSQNLITEMSQTGWWQLAPIHTGMSSNDDGVQRFVRVVPRTPDDLFTEVVPETSRQDDSTPQSLISRSADS